MYINVINNQCNISSTSTKHRVMLKMRVPPQTRRRGGSSCWGTGWVGGWPGSWRSSTQSWWPGWWSSPAPTPRCGDTTSTGACNIETRVTILSRVTCPPQVLAQRVGPPVELRGAAAHAARAEAGASHREAVPDQVQELEQPPRCQRESQV